MGMGQNLVPLVNPKIAGKWMFIPLKMVLIGIDPYPYKIFPHWTRRGEYTLRSNYRVKPLAGCNQWRFQTRIQKGRHVVDPILINYKPSH
jgi:hypothetical protein